MDMTALTVNFNITAQHVDLRFMNMIALALFCTLFPRCPGLQTDCIGARCICGRLRQVNGEVARCESLHLH